MTNEELLQIIEQSARDKVTKIQSLFHRKFWVERIYLKNQVIFTQPNGEDFRVNIWDFGGQEIYHQTHQFFLSKRSLYALVADTRKENTDFYWWLNVVELLSDNSPVIIIKNEQQTLQCWSLPN
nr:hypothetical protein [Atlanticothrix silvestris]